MTKTNWTTKSGKTIEIEITRRVGTRLIEISSMSIDGKEISTGASIRPEGIQFFINGQKLVTPMPATVAEMIKICATKTR